MYFPTSQVKKSPYPGYDSWFSLHSFVQQAFTEIFIHLFNKYLLSTYYVPGNVLDSGNTVVHKTVSVVRFSGSLCSGWGKEVEMNAPKKQLKN